MADVPQFAILAVKKGLITKEQLKECLELQLKNQKMGMDISLEQILINKKLLNRNNLKALLKAAGFKEKSPIPGFDVIQKLGEGGMGAVYLANQTRMDRKCALKVLPPKLAKTNPEFAERFLREARSVAKFSHPNIVAGYDVGQSGEFHYFAMEYVDGPSLKELLEERKKISESEALIIFPQICSGMEHASSIGMVHRDIKPDNILLTKNGTPKVADFGLAKMEASTELTQDGVALGTPAYISPEQALGQKEIDSRADIYSLGCTLFHAVTGQMPFTGDSPMVVMRSHIDTPIPDPKSINPEISDGMSNIIKKMTAKKPEDRFQSFSEILAAFESLKGKSPAGAPVGIGGNQQDGAKQKKKSPVLALVVVLAIIIGVGIVASLMMGDNPDKNNGGEIVDKTPNSSPTTQKQTPSPEPTQDKKVETPKTEVDPSQQALEKFMAALDGIKSSINEDPATLVKAITDLESLEKVTKELEIGKEVTALLENTKKKLDDIANNEFDKLTEKAEKQKRSLKFQAARDTLKEFPPVLAKTQAGEKMEKFVEKINEDIQIVVNAALSDGKEMVKEHQYDKAIERMTPLLECDDEVIINQLKEEISKTETAKKEYEEAQQTLAMLKKQQIYWAYMEKALGYTREFEFKKAFELAKETESKLDIPEIKDWLAKDQKNYQMSAQFWKSICKTLKGKKLKFKGVEGICTKFNTKTGTFSIDIKIEGNIAVQTFNWHKISSSERDSLMTQALLGNPSQEKTVFLILSGDDEDVRTQIELASNNQLINVDHLENVFVQLEKNNHEKEAEENFGQGKVLFEQQKWEELDSFASEYYAKYKDTVYIQSVVKEINKWQDEVALHISTWPTITKVRFMNTKRKDRGTTQYSIVGVNHRGEEIDLGGKDLPFTNAPDWVEHEIKPQPLQAVIFKVLKFHAAGGGLCELEVLDKNGNNIARDSRISSSSDWNFHEFGSKYLVDGKSDGSKNSYWLLKDKQPGWVRVDFDGFIKKQKVTRQIRTLTIQDIQEFFNGQVKTWDPTTRKVEILYDFMNFKDLEDWSVGSRPRVIKGKLYLGGKQISKHKAAWNKPIQFEYDIEADNGKHFGSSFVQSGGKVGQNGLYVFHRPETQAEGDGICVNAFAPNIAKANGTLVYKRKYHHKVIIGEDESVKWELNGKDYLNGNANIPVAPRYIQLITWEGSSSYDNIRISGILDLDWLSKIIENKEKIDNIHSDIKKGIYPVNENEQEKVKIYRRSKAYFVVNGQYTWFEARQISENMGGHLATITSKGEQDFVAEVLGDIEWAWLGASDEELEGKWLSWDNGERFTYKNWIDGQPNNAKNSEHWLIMRKGGGWDDVHSGNKGSFIVEWKVDK